MSHGERQWIPRLWQVIAERKLLLKVDIAVLGFLCLQFFVNYLDRANFANAYVSGMQKALNFKGRQFNNVSACFVAGFAFGQLPQNLILLYCRPRFVFAVNGITWGALTMASAAAKAPWHLYIIKLLQGFAEASTFVGAHFIMGSWYRSSELATRGAIFSSTAQIAGIFSGVLQSAIHTSMDGLAGCAGWQWQFLICGIVTVPVAAYGLFAFPDTPEKTTAKCFSAEEKQTLLARVPRHPVSKLSVAAVMRVLRHWPIWMLSLVWVAGAAIEAINTNSIMLLWLYQQNQVLKPSRYTVSQINLYPAGGMAVAVVALLALAVWTDRTGKRYQASFVTAGCLIVSASLLLKYTSIPTAAKFFAFYLSGVSYAGQATTFAWANELTREDNFERAIVLSTMNMCAYAFNVWWGLVFFAASDAPRWRKGYISVLVAAPILVLLSSGARFLQLRDVRRMAERKECEDSEASEPEPDRKVERGKQPTPQVKFSGNV